MKIFEKKNETYGKYEKDVIDCLSRNDPLNNK